MHRCFINRIELPMWIIGELMIKFYRYRTDSNVGQAAGCSE